MNALIKPMTISEIREKMDENGYVAGTVAIGIDAIIEYNLEQFLDACSMALVGDDLLMDVTYKVVGNKGDSVLFEVSGDVTGVLDMNETEVAAAETV